MAIQGHRNALIKTPEFAAKYNNCTHRYIQLFQSGFFPLTYVKTWLHNSIRAQDLVIAGTAYKSAVLRSNEDDAWNEHRI
jgi:hypothetical protein